MPPLPEVCQQASIIAADIQTRLVGRSLALVDECWAIIRPCWSAAGEADVK